LVWWATVWLFEQEQMTSFMFVVSTLIMAALSGAAIALLLLERRRRGTIIQDTVEELTLELREEVVRLQALLDKEGERFESLHDRYVSAIASAESTKHYYEDRLEESRLGAAELEAKRSSLLIVTGDQDDLLWDLTELRTLGMRIETMVRPRKEDFKAKMNTLRLSGDMPYNVHFALHGTRVCVEFPGGETASAYWLSEVLRGVARCSLAVCESASVAYEMRLIPARTMCFSGTPDSGGASRFMRKYYEYLLAGNEPRDALLQAKDDVDARVADLAIIV